MVEYIVEYDYNAVHEDELSIKVGEVIKNVKKLEEEGWLEGEVNGKRGMFPDNFVKEIKKEVEAKEENVPIKREKAGNVASLVQRMSTYGLPTIGLQPHPSNKSFKKKSKKRQCKVLFDYIPQNEDELELKVGDIVDINEEVEEGWWSGTLHGRIGLFPSNFVKELELTDDNEAQDGPDDADYVVTGSTSPASPVLSPGNGSEAGTGSIAQPKKVRGVGFGDIFKEGSVKLKMRLSSIETEEKKPEKTLSSPSLGPRASQTVNSEIMKAETDGKLKAKTFCRALFSYESSNEDELSFKEGDIIHLLSKDTGDPGWWKGELNGKEGVFPDNFAAVIQETEKEKPKKPPPPIKCVAPKSELIGEKNPPPLKSEDKEEKATIDQKPSKPIAPQVPLKKPIPPNKSNLLKPGVLLPKRPEKPVVPPPTSKPNGEVPLIRPKSEFEPLVKPKLDVDQMPPRPKSTDIDSYAVRSLKEIEQLSFDDVKPTSENLSHPTASRPKIHNRRLPGRFNGSHSPVKDLMESVKVHKEEEEEECAKPKPAEVKKPSLPTTPMLPSSPRPNCILLNSSGDLKTKADISVEELRAQISELLTIVEKIKTEHGKELEQIKRDLEEEKMMRNNLESEIEKLKKTIQST